MSDASNRQDDSGGSKFLATDSYIARFARDVSALQRLWLVPLGLCAFWLAIENSYDGFLSIKSGKEQLQAFVSIAEHQRAQRHRLEGQKGEAAQERFQAAERALLTAQKSVDAQKKDVKKLKSESVNLTVAGTQMPSRLSYAPTLFVAALFTWLTMFHTLKSKAQTHLAAAIAAYQHKVIPFGVAEENSIWLAPLPREVCLRIPCEGGIEAVSRAQTLTFLGWAAEEERGYRRLTRMVWLAVSLWLLRVVLISAEVNSTAAVALEITDPFNAYVNSIGTAVFAASCVYLLLRLSGVVAPVNSWTAPAGRREAIAALAGAIALFAFIRTKPVLHEEARRALSGGRISGLNPRFVSKSASNASRVARGVWSKHGRPGDVFVTYPKDNSYEDGPLKFYGVGNEGRLRFYPVRPKVLRRVAPKLFEAITRGALAAKAHDRFRAARRTSFLEAAALALVERGRAEDACLILLGACRISLLAQQPNVRLFDLLAGLAVRYRGRRFQEEVEKLVRERAGAHPSLARRIDQWKGQNWLEHWQSPKVIHWGHPAERITVERQRGRNSVRTLKARPVPLPPLQY